MQTRVRRPVLLLAAGSEFLGVSLIIVEGSTPSGLTLKGGIETSCFRAECFKVSHSLLLFAGGSLCLFSSAVGEGAFSEDD